MPKESLRPALLPHSRVIKKLPKQLFCDIYVSASPGNTEDEADIEFVSLILSGTFLSAWPVQRYHTRTGAATTT